MYLDIPATEYMDFKQTHTSLYVFTRLLFRLRSTYGSRAGYCSAHILTSWWLTTKRSTRQTVKLAKKPLAVGSRGWCPYNCKGSLPSTKSLAVYRAFPLITHDNLHPPTIPSSIPPASSSTSSDPPQSPPSLPTSRQHPSLPIHISPSKTQLPGLRATP